MSVGGRDEMKGKTKDEKGMDLLGSLILKCKYVTLESFITIIIKCSVALSLYRKTCKALHNVFN